VLGVSHIGTALWVLIFLKEMTFLVGYFMMLSVSETPASNELYEQLVKAELESILKPS
jgi:hypothetical protein